MFRSFLLAVAALTLTASLSLADPGFQILYQDGVPRVQIEGNYANSTYTIWRAQSIQGPWRAVTNQNILCLGNCFADDRTALPARATGIDSTCCSPMDAQRVSDRTKSRSPPPCSKR